MKKIILFALSACTAFTSCELDIAPDTSLKGEEALTLEYINGIRLGIYSNIKGVTSGGYLYYADYQTDLFNETSMSGNRGGFFYRWWLYDSDQDIDAMWNGYYSVIRNINYGLKKIGEFAELDVDGEYAEDIAHYTAELRFFRAYVLHQLALRFCEDYEPAEATRQLGIPTPDEYNPDAQLERGTLQSTYAFILKDIEAAESTLQNIPGEQDAIYLTADAVTAFKAQVALQMHDYPAASTYASSLYGSYPLVNTFEDIEKMWREDISTETIFQPEVRTTSLGTVGDMRDYYAGSWSEAYGIFLCQPAYALANMPATLYDEQKDLRYGNYVSPSVVVSGSSLYNAVLMTKFIGNKTLQTTKTLYTYRNMPKIFRVAEMYLIDAEAQYQAGGDALTPLNALRQARGLDALQDISGEDLFTEIKNERIRETLGEGHRLTDLKRWHDGFSRTYQSSIQGILRNFMYTIDPVTDKDLFTWPIPIQELSNNLKFGAQNPGY